VLALSFGFSVGEWVFFVAGALVLALFSLLKLLNKRRNKTVSLLTARAHSAIDMLMQGYDVLNTEVYS